MNNFPLYNSTCDLAHHFWKELLKEGDSVIDATLGNGHDTLFLAKCVLGSKMGAVFGFDIQQSALENTKELLKGTFNEEALKRVVLFHESHDQMERLVKEPVKLIVYNLGYLPGGNKDLTTQTESTLKSLEQGMRLLESGGALSIVCYPGHAEGEREEKALMEFFSGADPKIWSVSHTRLLNRKKAPSVLIVQKSE